MASTLHELEKKFIHDKSTPNHPVDDSNPSTQTPGQDGSGGEEQEQKFNILPHPAKSNDPADLQNPSEQTGELKCGQEVFEAFSAAPGPVLPSQETLNSLPPAKTHDELNAMTAELNKGN